MPATDRNTDALRSTMDYPLSWGELENASVAASNLDKRDPEARRILGNDAALQAIRVAAADPMWADHAEVSKATLKAACLRIQELTLLAIKVRSLANYACACLDRPLEAASQLHALVGMTNAVLDDSPHTATK